MPQNHIILGPENVAVKGQTKNSHGDYGEDSDLLLDSGGSQRKNQERWRLSCHTSTQKKEEFVGIFSY